MPRRGVGTHCMGKAILQKVYSHPVYHRPNQESGFATTMADHARQATQENDCIRLKKPAMGEIEADFCAIARRIDLAPDFRHCEKICIGVVEARNTNRQRRQSSPRKALARMEGT